MQRDWRKGRASSRLDLYFRDHNCVSLFPLHTCVRLFSCTQQIETCFLAIRPLFSYTHLSRSLFTSHLCQSFSMHTIDRDVLTRKQSSIFVYTFVSVSFHLCQSLFMYTIRQTHASSQIDLPCELTSIFVTRLCQSLFTTHLCPSLFMYAIDRHMLPRK